MTVSGHPLNQLLQLLDAADFDLPRPHLATVEMVSKSVVGEIGTAPRHVYLPHGGCVSIRVSLSEGQTIEIAMLGRDSVVGAGAALADGISPMDAVVLFPGAASVIEIGVFRAVATASARLRKLMVRHDAGHARACAAIAALQYAASGRGSARALAAPRPRPVRRPNPAADPRGAGADDRRPRNAISLVAHALQRAGIIRYSRGQIEIIDPKALLATSCGCYSAVKTHHLRLMGVVA